MWLTVNPTTFILVLYVAGSFSETEECDLFFVH